MFDFGKSSVWARFTVVCLGLVAATSAHATLLGDAVNITLASPNETGVPISPFSLTETGITVVSPGLEVATGDSTNIGSSGIMLASEFVDIQADRLIFRIESGAAGGTTGYAPGAYWEVSDLDDSLGTITGFDVFLSNISSFDVNNDVSFLGGDTFRVPISSLIVGSLNQGVYGDIEIRLRTGGTPPPPVPEPGTLALLALGLGAIGISRGRRADR